MTCLRFILLPIIFTLRFYDTSINISRLCNNQLNGMYDLNCIIGLNRNSTPKFEKDMFIKVIDGHYRWYIDCYTSFGTGDMNLNNGILASTYNELNLVISIFETEWYIDVNLSKYIPVKICGIVGRAIALFHNASEGEYCRMIEGMSFVNSTTISKVRFSQISGQSIKIYEFYRDYVVASSLENTAGIALTRLVYRKIGQQYPIQASNGPGFFAIIHNCDVAKQIESQDPYEDIWVQDAIYENKRLLVLTNYICDFVREGEIYDLMHHNIQNNEAFVIPKVKLFQLTNPEDPSAWTKTLYLYVKGNFTFKNKRFHTYNIFDINITQLAQAYNWPHMPLATTEGFSINMTQNVVGQCSLLLHNYKTRSAEEYIFHPFEKFNLTQTVGGVNGSLVININGISILNFPNCYIARISCDTNGQIIPNLFAISKNPKIILKLQLKICPIL